MRANGSAMMRPTAASPSTSGQRRVRRGESEPELYKVFVGSERVPGKNLANDTPGPPAGDVALTGRARAKTRQDSSESESKQMCYVRE